MAHRQALHGPRETLVATIARSQGEVPVAEGLTCLGTVLEVLASPSGTWTIIVTSQSGQSCTVAAGESWSAISPNPLEDPV